MKTRAVMGVRILFWGLAATPFLWMILFWSFVLRTRLSIGYWPSPYQPDPKDLGFVAHHFFFLVGTLPLALVAAALVAGILFLRYRFLSDAGARPVWTAAFALLGCAILLLWGQTDPGHFLYWFGD